MSLENAALVTINGRPLVPTGHADFVTSISRLRDVRSGDILLMANYTAERTAVEPPGTGDWEDGGYYFGVPLPAWHGSLYDTDMTIPLIFSFPYGEGESFGRFLNAVNDEVPAVPGGPPCITNAPRATYKLLTGEEYL